MSRTGDIDSDLVNKVAEEYKKAAFWLPFSALEIKEVFSEAEMKQLEEFRKEMKTAAANNKMRADAIKKFSAIVSKLLKLAKIAV